MEVYTEARGRTLAQIPPLARRAEEMGFDGVSFNETTLDPFLACTLGAEHTQRMKLGTSVALAFPRSPMTTAYMAWNLQALSGGRFELGLGTQVRGHIQRRFSVPWTPPGPRIREYVEALRAIWDCWQNGTQLSYQGSSYTFSLMTPLFNPGPIPCGSPRVYVAAVGPVMCRVAGEVADGVLLHSLVSAKYVEEMVLPNLEAGAGKAGRSLADLVVSGGGFITVDQGQDERSRSYEATRRRIAFYASTPAYRGVLDVHGWARVADELRELSFKGQWEEMASLVTEEMMDAFCVAGSFQTIGARIKARYGGYATRVSLPMPEDHAADGGQVRGLIQELHAVGVS